MNSKKGRVHLGKRQPSSRRSQPLSSSAQHLTSRNSQDPPHTNARSRSPSRPALAVTPDVPNSRDLHRNAHALTQLSRSQSPSRPLHQSNHHLTDPSSVPPTQGHASSLQTSTPSHQSFHQQPHHVHHQHSFAVINPISPSPPHQLPPILHSKHSIPIFQQFNPSPPASTFTDSFIRAFTRPSISSLFYQHVAAFSTSNNQRHRRDNNQNNNNNHNRPNRPNQSPSSSSPFNKDFFEQPMTDPQSNFSPTLRPGRKIPFDPHKHADLKAFVQADGKIHFNEKGQPMLHSGVTESTNPELFPDSFSATRDFYRLQGKPYPLDPPTPSDLNKEKNEYVRQYQLFHEKTKDPYYFDDFEELVKTHYIMTRFGAIEVPVEVSKKDIERTLREEFRDVRQDVAFVELKAMGQRLIHMQKYWAVRRRDALDEQEGSKRASRLIELHQGFDEQYHEKQLDSLRHGDQSDGPEKAEEDRDTVVWDDSVKHLETDAHTLLHHPDDYVKQFSDKIPDILDQDIGKQPQDPSKPKHASFDIRVLLDERDLDVAQTPQSRTIDELTKKRNAELGPEENEDGHIWADDEQKVIDSLKSQSDRLVEERKAKLHEIHQQMEDQFTAEDSRNFDKKVRNLDFTRDEILELLVAYRLNEKKVERRELIATLREAGIREMKIRGEDDGDLALRQYVNEGLKVYDAEMQKQKKASLDTEIDSMDLFEDGYDYESPELSNKIGQILEDLAKEGKYPETDKDLFGKSPDEVEEIVGGISRKVLNRLKAEAIEKKHGELRLMGVDPQSDAYATFLQNLDLDREDIKIIQFEYEKFMQNKKFMTDFDRVGRAQEQYIAQNRLSSVDLLQQLSQINTIVSKPMPASPSSKHPLIADVDTFTNTPLHLPFSTPVIKQRSEKTEPASTTSTTTPPTPPSPTSTKQPFTFSKTPTTPPLSLGQLEDVFPTLENAKLGIFFTSLDPNKLTHDQRHRYNLLYNQYFSAPELNHNDPNLVSDLKQFKKLYDATSSAGTGSPIQRKGAKQGKDDPNTAFPQSPNLTPQQQKVLKLLPVLLNISSPSSDQSTSPLSDEDRQILTSQLTLGDLATPLLELYKAVTKDPNKFLKILQQDHERSLLEPPSISPTQPISKHQISQLFLKPVLQLQEKKASVDDFVQFLKQYQTATLLSLENDMLESERAEMLAKLTPKLDATMGIKPATTSSDGLFTGEADFDQLSEDGLESVTAIDTAPIKRVSTSKKQPRSSQTERVKELHNTVQTKLQSGSELSPEQHQKLHAEIFELYPELDLDLDLSDTELDGRKKPFSFDSLEPAPQESAPDHPLTPQEIATKGRDRQRKRLISTQKIVASLQRYILKEHEDNLPRHIESLQSISELLKTPSAPDDALKQLSRANRLAKQISAATPSPSKSPTPDQNLDDFAESQSVSPENSQQQQQQSRPLSKFEKVLQHKDPSISKFTQQVDSIGKLHQERMRQLEEEGNSSFGFDPETQRIQVKYPIADPIFHSDNYDTLTTTSQEINQAMKTKLIHEFTNRPIYQQITIPADRLRISDQAIDRLIDTFRKESDGDDFFGKALERSNDPQNLTTEALLKEMTDSVSFSPESLHHLSNRLKSVNILQVSQQLHGKMEYNSRVLQLILALGGPAAEKGVTPLRIGPNGLSLNDTGIVGKEYIDQVTDQTFDVLGPDSQLPPTSQLFSDLHRHVSSKSSSEQGKFRLFNAKLDKRYNNTMEVPSESGVSEFTERVSLAATPVQLINPVLTLDIVLSEADKANGRPEPVRFLDHFGWSHEVMWPELQWYKSHQNTLGQRDMLRMQYMDELFMEYQRYLSMKGLFFTYHPEFAPDDEKEKYLLKHYEWKRYNVAMKNESAFISQKPGSAKLPERDVTTTQSTTSNIRVGADGEALDMATQLLSPAMVDLRRESEYNLQVVEHLLLNQPPKPEAQTPNKVKAEMETQLKQAYESQRYPDHHALRELRDLEHQELLLRQKLQPVPTITELKQSVPDNALLSSHDLTPSQKELLHVIPTQSDISIYSETGDGDKGEKSLRVVHPFQIDAVELTKEAAKGFAFSKPFTRPESIQDILDAQLKGAPDHLLSQNEFTESPDGPNQALPEQQQQLQPPSRPLSQPHTSNREKAIEKINKLKASFLSSDSLHFDHEMTTALSLLNAPDQKKELEQIIMNTSNTTDLRAKVATKINSLLQQEVDFLVNLYAEISIDVDGKTTITRVDPANPHIIDPDQSVSIDLAELYQSQTLPASELKELQGKVKNIDAMINQDNAELRKLEHVQREKYLLQFEQNKHQIAALIAERNAQFAQNTEDQFNAEKRRVLLPLDKTELAKLPLKEQEEHLHIQFIKSVLDFTKAVLVDSPSDYQIEKQVEYILEQRRQRYLIHKSKHFKQSYFWSRVKYRIDNKLSIEHLQPDFDAFKLTEAEQQVDEPLNPALITYDLDVIVRDAPWQLDNVKLVTQLMDATDSSTLAPQREWFNRPNTTFLANLQTLPWTKYSFAKEFNKAREEKIARGEELSEQDQALINDPLKLNGEALTVTERRVEHDKEELRLILAHIQLQNELTQTTKSIAQEKEFSELHQRLLSKIDNDWKVVERQYDELVQQTTRAFKAGEIDNEVLEDRLVKLSTTFQHRSKELETQHMKYMKFFNDYILYTKDLQSAENLTRLRALHVLQESDSYRQRQLRIEQIALTLDQIRSHERARMKLQAIGIEDSYESENSHNKSPLDPLAVKVFDATGKAYTRGEVINHLEELAQLIEEQKSEHASIVNFLQQREDIFKRRKNLRQALNWMKEHEEGKKQARLLPQHSLQGYSKEQRIIITRLRSLAIEDSLQGKTVKGVQELLANVEAMTPAQFVAFDYDGRFAKALIDVQESDAHKIDIQQVLGTQYTPLGKRRNAPTQDQRLLLAGNGSDGGPTEPGVDELKKNAENPDIAPPRDSRFYSTLTWNPPGIDHSAAVDQSLGSLQYDNGLSEYNSKHVLQRVFPELTEEDKERKLAELSVADQWTNEDNALYTPLQQLVQETSDILALRNTASLKNEIEMELQILKDLELGLYTNLHQFRFTNDQDVDRTKIDPLTGRYPRKWIIPPQWDSSKHPPQHGEEEPYFVDPITTPDEVKKALLRELQLEQLGGELIPMDKIYEDNFESKPIPTYRDTDIQRGKYDHLLPQKELREKRKPPKPKRPLLPELPFQMPYLPYYEGEDLGPWDGDTRLRREQIYLINLYRRQKKRIRYEHQRDIRAPAFGRHHRRPKRFKIRPPIHEEMETFFRERPGPLERWDYENLSRTEWVNFNLQRDGGRTANIIHRFLETEDYRLFFKWRKGYVRGLYFFKYLFRKYSTPQGTLELLGNCLLIVASFAMMLGISQHVLQWENVQLAGSYQNYLHHKHLAFWYNSIRRVIEMDLVRWNELFSVVDYFRGEQSGSDPMIAYMYNHENWAEWFRQKTLKGTKIRVPIIGDGPTAYQPREVMPKYRILMKNTLTKFFEIEAHAAYTSLSQFESSIDSLMSEVVECSSEKEKIKHLSRLIDPLTKITEVAYSRDNKILRPGFLHELVNPLKKTLRYTYDRLVLPTEILYKNNPMAPYEKEIRAIPQNIYPRSGWGVDPISSRLFEQYTGVLCKEEYLAALDQERNLLEKIRNYIVMVGNQFGMNIPTNRLQVLVLDTDQQMSAQFGFARDEWVRENGDQADITLLANNAGLRYKYFSPLRDLSQQFNSLIQSTTSPLLAREDSTQQQLELMSLSKQFGDMSEIYGPTAQSQKSDWKKGYHNLITPVSTSPQIGRLFSLTGDFTSSTTYPYPAQDLTDPTHRLAHAMLTTHQSKGMATPLIPTIAHRPYVDNEYYPFVDTSIVPDRFKPGLQYKNRFVRLLHALSGEKYTRYFYATDHNTDYLRVLTRPNKDELGFSDDRLSLAPTNSVIGDSGYSGMNLSPTSSTANNSLSNLSKNNGTINFLGSLLKIPLHIFENSKLVQREQMIEVIGNLLVKYDSCISMIIQEQHRVGLEQQEILHRRNLMLTGRYEGEHSMVPSEMENYQGFLREYSEPSTPKSQPTRTFDTLTKSAFIPDQPSNSHRM